MTRTCAALSHTRDAKQDFHRQARQLLCSWLYWVALKNHCAEASRLLQLSSPPPTAAAIESCLHSFCCNHAGFQGKQAFLSSAHVCQCWRDEAYLTVSNRHASLIPRWCKCSRQFACTRICTAQLQKCPGLVCYKSSFTDMLRRSRVRLTDAEDESFIVPELQLRSSPLLQQKQRWSKG